MHDDVWRERLTDERNSKRKTGVWSSAQNGVKYRGRASFNRRSSANRWRQSASASRGGQITILSVVSEDSAGEAGTGARWSVGNPSAVR